MLAEEIFNYTPTLTTNRLALRSFIFEDTKRLAELLSDRLISQTSPTIPYPYDEKAASDWLTNQFAYCCTGQFYFFAITLKDTKELIGSISLTIKPEKQAEIGFWIGTPYWNNGYCKEAAAEVIKYTFSELKLNRVYAECMRKNNASTSVLKKLGMEFEAQFVVHIHRARKNFLLDRYIISRDDFNY